MWNPSDMDMDNSDAANTDLEGYATAWDDEVGDEAFDGSDDAEALASAGHGTDEDYGYYGGEDSYLDSYFESLTEDFYGGE